MKSKIVVAGHAVHPMLIVFPLGLLGTSVAWDVCALVTHSARWGTLAYWTIVAGIIGGLVAAVPGFIDWLGIPRGTRARAVGFTHMVLNVAVLALFAISLWARQSSASGYEQAGAGAMAWGWGGVLLAVVSGWLGGELVETMGISVQEGANPDAGSSLRGEHGGTRRPGAARHPADDVVLPGSAGANRSGQEDRNRHHRGM